MDMRFLFELMFNGCEIDKNIISENDLHKNYFYNVALSDKSGKFIHMIDKDLESKVVDQLSTNINELKKTFSTTLTSVLDEIKAPNLIDFFSLDVEGFEEKVIKGIDFKKYNFKFFLILVICAILSFY